MGTAESSTITNGMLSVDFYDPTSKQLIWRGTAAETLNPSGNQEKDIKRLNKGVAKLLKHFPPNGLANHQRASLYSPVRHSS